MGSVPPASPLIGLVTLGLTLSGRGRAIECHGELACADTACNDLKFRSGPNGLTALERWLYVSGLDKLPQLPRVLAARRAWSGRATSRRQLNCIVRPG